MTNFSTYLFLLIEKLFLARLSIQAVEAALNAAYACQVFQGAAVALAMMAQVFVGRWQGAEEERLIGPGLWQFIWFSFLSLLLVVPCGLVYGQFYFRGTSLADIVFPYYYFLLATSFLFPLGAALSCFYLGRGKTQLVLWTTFASQLVKIGLGYVLIFGWGDILPAWGLLGGAMSTAIAQAAFCLVLFLVFLQKRNALQFDGYNWYFKPKLFWECIHPGLLRAANRILSISSWASVAQLMTIRGGEYLAVLSLGGTILMFLSFLGDAICQTYMIIVSQILGSRHYHLLQKAFRLGVILVSLVISILAIPLLGFPNYSFYLLFPTISVPDTMIQNIFLGVWGCAAFYAFGFIPISYVLAYKDMKFSFFMGCFSWVNGFLLMYVALVIIGIPADHFWTVLTLMHGSVALLYYWRMKKLQARSLALSKSF